MNYHDKIEIITKEGGDYIGYFVDRNKRHVNIAITNFDEPVISISRGNIQTVKTLTYEQE